MKFAEVIGHKELKRKLIEGVDAGRVSHAQLFCGLSGSGSFALALAYAQYLNCTNRSGGDACGECPSCVKIGQLVHPDLHFVFPVNSAKTTSANKPTSDFFVKQWRELVLDKKAYFSEHQWYEKLGLDNQQGLITKNEADEILRKLSFKSFEGRYKIMLIWLPERMRTEAANSLLKILEEPWDRTVFLLVSEQSEKLLATILSRTQQVSVPRIDAESLAGYLAESYSLDEQKAQEYARLSGGDLIEAQRLVAGEQTEFNKLSFDYFVELMRLSYNDKHLELIELADNIAGMGRENQKLFLQNAIRLLRNSYMINAGVDSIVYLWGEEKEFCKKFSPFIGNHNIEALVAEMELALSQVAQNGNARMIFTHFVLSVSKRIIKLK